MRRDPLRGGKLRYLFADCTLDTDRRELRRGADLTSVEPQVFDLLEYLIRNRNRVVSKDDLVAAIWHGRIVSQPALATRINAARSAVGDSGDQQHLIKTLPRKGIRFVGTVGEDQKPECAAIKSNIDAEKAALTLPDKPSIAVLPFTNMSGDSEQEYFADGVADETSLRCRDAVRCSLSRAIRHSPTRAKPSTCGRLDASSACAMSWRAACGEAATGFDSPVSSLTRALEHTFGQIVSRATR